MGHLSRGGVVGVSSICRWDGDCVTYLKVGWWVCPPNLEVEVGVSPYLEVGWWVCTPTWRWGGGCVPLPGGGVLVGVSPHLEVGWWVCPSTWRWGVGCVPLPGGGVGVAPVEGLALPPVAGVEAGLQVARGSHHRRAVVTICTHIQ